MNEETWLSHPLAPLPVPAVALDGFEVVLGEGFGGSIHELAEGMEIFGTSDAARVLLSLIGFVEKGVAGLKGSEGLLGRMRLLRGAVMSAGTAVRLPGVGIMMENGLWDGAYLKRLGRRGGGWAIEKTMGCSGGDLSDIGLKMADDNE